MILPTESSWFRRETDHDIARCEKAGESRWREGGQEDQEKHPKELKYCQQSETSGEGTEEEKCSVKQESMIHHSMN